MLLYRPELLCKKYLDRCFCFVEVQKFRSDYANNTLLLNQQSWHFIIHWSCSRGYSMRLLRVFQVWLIRPAK